MVEKILISRCNRLMMVNGYPLPIGYLHFNRGKSASNHGIKSTHSLDEGDILGGKEAFLMTQKPNTCKQPPTCHLLIRRFLKSSFKAALLWSRTHYPGQNCLVMFLSRSTQATFMGNWLCTPCAKATRKRGKWCFVFLLTIGSSGAGMWRMLKRKKGKRKQKR